MSYIKRLLDQATTTNGSGKENNRIGNYRINPQHGKDLFVYHLYKDNAKDIETKRLAKNEVHLATITIEPLYSTVSIRFSKDYATGLDIMNMCESMKEFYPIFTRDAAQFS